MELDISVSRAIVIGLSNHKTVSICGILGNFGSYMTRSIRLSDYFASLGVGFRLRFRCHQIPRIWINAATGSEELSMSLQTLQA